MSQCKNTLLSRTICIFQIKLHLVPAVAMLIITAILLKLGFWQLNRLEYKKALMNSIEESILGEPKSNDKSLQHVKSYEKIKLKGRFLPKQTIFVYGQRSAFRVKHGYYVLTPFQTNDGDIILVARFWITYQMKPIILDKIIEDTSEQEIIGITLPGERKGLFAPSNDIAQKIWFTIDLDEASRALGININHIYLLGTDIQNNIEGVAPLYATHLSKIRNDHLEYALTWFTLAISLFIMYMIWEYKMRRRG